MVREQVAMIRERPLLDIIGIEKRFGSFRALKGCSLDVGAGETVVLIGPSGSGKSTFLRCINFLEPPDAGSVVFKGEEVGRNPDELSGGQQQRVAIARALAMKPAVMLYDEPTSALDPEMIREVLDVMTDLSGEGMTSVVVTHEMGFAKRAADRVVFMDAGEIVERAASADFFGGAVGSRARKFLDQILH